MGLAAYCRDGQSAQTGVGELAGVLRDPFAGRTFYRYAFAQLLFAQQSIVLDLADLLDHAGAKQGVFVDEGDAHQVAICQFAAPGNEPGIARLVAKQWNA